MKKFFIIGASIVLLSPALALAQTQSLPNLTTQQVQNTLQNNTVTTQNAPTQVCANGTTAATGQGCNLTYTPLEPIPGVTASNPNLSQYLSGLYTLSITVGALIAVAILTWSGIQLMTTESMTTETRAKKRIWSALIGLLVVVGSFLIIYTLNPSALTFNFSPQAAVTGQLSTNTTTTTTQNQIAAYTTSLDSAINQVQTDTNNFADMTDEQRKAQYGDPTYCSNVQNQIDLLSAQMTNLATQYGVSGGICTPTVTATKGNADFDTACQSAKISLNDYSRDQSYCIEYGGLQ